MEVKMEIPLNAQVECKDGICGTSVYVLINPVLDEITHLVVKEFSAVNKEYLVPVSLISTTIVDTIQLICTKAELEGMEPFIQTEYVEEKVPDPKNAIKGGPLGMNTFYMPYVVPQTKVYEPQKHFQIPAGELAIRRGTRVEAEDGFIGIVDEFVVDPDTCHITHLVMRERHLLGQKDVIIPVSAVRETHDNVVHLNINKHQIGLLPAFPVKRLWT
jgi:hypothetical protein